MPRLCFTSIVKNEINIRHFISQYNEGNVCNICASLLHSMSVQHDCVGNDEKLLKILLREFTNDYAEDPLGW